MELDNLLYVIVLFLGATAICVTLFDRLGLGSVGGWLHSRGGADRSPHPRAAFLSTTDADRLRMVAVYLHERYPDLDIYARVQTLDEQEALRTQGIKHAGTTYLESTLFRGQSLLQDMGVAEEQAKALIDSLRKDDYQVIKNSFSKARTVSSTA